MFYNGRVRTSAKIFTAGTSRAQMQSLGDRGSPRDNEMYAREDVFCGVRNVKRDDDQAVAFIVYGCSAEKWKRLMLDVLISFFLLHNKGISQS
ncbi:hypothetical protein Trydic_g9192 [Trypoxylus dichotomus]